MKINTKYFGEAEIDDSSLLHFGEGLWSFEKYKTYALISFGDDDEGLMCLQSVEEPSIAFVVINPFVIQPDYAPELEEADQQKLGIGQDTPVSFLSVVVVKDDPENSTANLRCPVVLNLNTRQARQVLLAEEYPLRQPLAPQTKKEA